MTKLKEALVKVLKENFSDADLDTMWRDFAPEDWDEVLDETNKKEQANETETA